jgi:hypothetical protein
VLPGLGLEGWLGEALWMTQPSFLVRLHDFMFTLQSALHIHVHAYFESFIQISDFDHVRFLEYADHVIQAQCAAIYRAVINSPHLAR